MKPRTTSYKVKRGDSLWSISTYAYGDPKYWPEIAEANHLAKPDLILIGQLLKITDLSSHAKSPTHIATGHNNHPTVTPVLSPNVNPKRLARPLRYPAYKYDLEKVFPPVTAVIPPFKYKISLKGEITLQSQNTIPDVTLTKYGIETKYLDLKNTEMVLAPGGTEAVAISIWDNKENANAYARTSYPEVLKNQLPFWNFETVSDQDATNV
jgi:LysM domain